MTTAPDLTPRHVSRGIVAHPLGVSCTVTGTGTRTGTRDSRPGRSLNDWRVMAGLRRAAEHGATFLDTSDSFGGGHSERLIGRFLRDYPEGHFRLSSKVGRIRGSAPHPYAGRHIHHQLEQCLENLYVEYVDVYTLESLDFGPDDRYLGSAIDQMRALRDVGHIRTIGLRLPHPGYGASPAVRAAQARRFVYLFEQIKPDVIWTVFNALLPAVPLGGENAFAFAARHGAGLVLAGPLAHGLLTARTLSERSAPKSRGAGGTSWCTPRSWAAIRSGLRSLRGRFGDEPGTLTRLALRFCLQQAAHSIVVVGVTGEEYADEIYACLGNPLTDTELAVLDDVYARVRLALAGSAVSDGWV